MLTVEAIRMTTKIKICGMRDSQNLQKICLLQPDFVGFIFYPPSKRFVGENFDSAMLFSVPKNIRKVGVFVNETHKNILEKKEKYNLDIIQLHGEESSAFCADLERENIALIKVFSVSENFDFQTVESYLPYVNYFLFDTKTPQYGGSGKKFDWNLLENYTFEKPFLLSGGIGTEDVEQIKKIQISSLYGLDLNSQFETAPACKDVQKIHTFMERLKTTTP